MTDGRYQRCTEGLTRCRVVKPVAVTMTMTKARLAVTSL
jgi:hypothetical protein